MIRFACLVAAILLAAPVFAQTVPTIGTDATLDVATWNVEHFGNPTSGPSNDGLQLNNVLAVMRQADIDLWALQEMDFENYFDRLLDSLGTGFDGHWQADETSFDIGYGYIWKTAIIQPQQISRILTSSSYEFAFRPPLQMRANVILPDTTVELRFIDVHMKANDFPDGEESYNRRVAASGILKNYTDNLQSIGANVLVLGDFNDELILSIYLNRTSPYRNFLDDDDYFFITEDFDMPGFVNDKYTYCSNSGCSNGSVLDHMVASSTFGNDLVANSTDHFFDLIAAIPSYTSTTSDHLPVYARFAFQPEPVAAEPGMPSQHFSLDSAFPNPFTGSATIAYSLSQPGPVRLELIDMLGRRVAVVENAFQTVGTHRVLVEASSLSPGIYVARLTADGQTATLRLVRGR